MTGWLLAMVLAAAAAEDPALKKARTLFAEGDGQRAARELDAVYARTSDPHLLLEIGRAYQLAADPGPAVRAYTRWLSEFPAAANSEEIRQTVVELTPLTFKDAPPPAKDILPPRIEHAPRRTWPAGEAITIESAIKDSSGLYEPTLYVRIGGHGAFVRSELRPAEADRYVGLVAPMEVGEVQYFLEAFDSKGNGPARSGTPSYPYTLQVVDPTRVARSSEEEPSPSLPELSSAPAEQPPLVRADGGMAARRGPWAYTAFGAGALAAVAGVYLGMRAVSAGGEWAAATSQTGIDDARSRGESAAFGATLSWSAAGVLLAGGGALFFFTEF